MSELYAKNAKNSIRKTFEVVSRWIFILILPISLLALVFPARILSITFGKTYIDAAMPLAILIIGYFLLIFLGLSEQGLRIFKKTKFLGISTSLALVWNIILNILLVPRYGIIGAATATTISLVTLSLVRYFVFKRVLKFSYDRLLYVKYISSGIISLIVVFYTFKLLNLFGTLFFILAILTYVISYFTLLIVFKSFSEADIAILEAVERKIGVKLKVLKKFLR